MSQIVRCRISDISNVMSFIDEHWSRGHILSRNRALMDWQYRDTVEPENYNWLIARTGDSIEGILGFIPSTRYDSAAIEKPAVWLALWKVRPDIKKAGLGLQLLSHLSRSMPNAAIAVSGINFAHPPMYRAMGFQTGELQQHFMCNSSLPQTIVSAPDGFVYPSPKSGSVELTVADLCDPKSRTDYSAALRTRYFPSKSPEYFFRRFFDHPVYSYNVFAVKVDGRTTGLLAVRIAHHFLGRVLRIVDFSGDPSALAGCGSALGMLMQQFRCEYCDVWNSGAASSYLEQAGFLAVEAAGPVTVPNYFEPFLNQNGRILFAVKGIDISTALIFRADGDQDRPNLDKKVN